MNIFIINIAREFYRFSGDILQKFTFWSVSYD